MIKVYRVTTVEVNLDTFKQETITTIRPENEMASFRKPRKLFKTITEDSILDGNRFFSVSVTRIR